MDRIGEGIRRRYETTSRWEMFKLLRHLGFKPFRNYCYWCEKRVYFFKVKGVVPIDMIWELLCCDEGIEWYYQEYMKPEQSNVSEKVIKEIDEIMEGLGIS